MSKSSLPETVSSGSERPLKTVLYDVSGNPLLVSGAAGVVQLAAGTAVIGKVRLVTEAGDEVTDDTFDAVRVVGFSFNGGVERLGGYPSSATADDAATGSVLTFRGICKAAGSTTERVQGNQGATILASAARTAETNSADQTLRAGLRGVRLSVNVSAIVDTPSITVNVQVKDPVSGTYTTVLSSAAIVGTGLTHLMVYPGCVAVANKVLNEPLARTWRVNVAHADTDSITYSIAADLLE